MPRVWPLLACCLPCSLALQLLPAVVQRPSTAVRAAPPAMFDVDMNTIIAGGVLLGSTVGGVALVQFAENAGKRNEASELQQTCVVCKTRKVVDCTICKGTGADPLADLVRGVRDASGESGPTGTVELDDWEDGPKQVEMYAEILVDYPQLVTDKVCENCNGRGVIVCDNCQVRAGRSVARE